jgi:hypothetical protein
MLRAREFKTGESPVEGVDLKFLLERKAQGLWGSLKNIEIFSFT